MKKLILISVAVIIAVMNYSCSESTDPSDDPNIKVVAQMTSNVVDVNAMKAKHPDFQASTIDSIVIKDFRILLSEMKFQQIIDDEDSVTNDRTMKSGPFLLKLDSTGKSFTLADGPFSRGRYSKIKFELHRFSASETTNYVNDEIYGDFATADRYSVIIKGLIYENGVSEAFVFNGTVTANLWLKFDPDVVFYDTGDYTITLDIDPNSAFISGNTILDPRVQKDANDIDNAVKDAFKSVKKK